MFGRTKNRTPTTLVGIWMRVGANRQSPEVRRKLKAELDRTGWTGAEAVVHAAFELSVKFFYSDDNKILEPFDVPGLVSGIREYFGSDGVDKFPQREGEVLVRTILGEDVEDYPMDRKVAFTACGLIFAGLMFSLQLSEAEIDKFIVDAEDLAIQRGARPTSVTREQMALVPPM